MTWPSAISTLVAEGHRALTVSKVTRFLRRTGDRLGAAGVPRHPSGALSFEPGCLGDD